MLTLYFLRGVPGCGKSTLAKELWQLGVASLHLEADSFFYDEEGNYNFDPSFLGAAHKGCQESARKALEFGMSVIVSNTSTTEKEVQVYQQIAEDSGARFISLVVENRHNGKNIHNVPEEKIQQMKNRFSIKL